MDFYTDMSRYYDLLFPVSAEQEKFFAEIVRDFRPMKILDAACGSGNQMLCFAKRGLSCFGFDINPDMVTLAREKLSEYKNSVVKEGSFGMMRQLFDTKFGLILNLGNSLVHVPKKEAEFFVSQAAEMLNKNGMLLLQILNYDHILEEKIEELPPLILENEDLSFKRFYGFTENEKIMFTTKIDVPSKGIAFSHTIPLYPLKKAELLEMLKRAGLTVMGTFPGFVGKKFEPDSDAIVVMAKK